MTSFGRSGVSEVEICGNRVKTVTLVEEVITALE
jgi:hypothetical protein